MKEQIKRVKESEGPALKAMATTDFDGSALTIGSYIGALNTLVSQQQELLEAYEEVLNDISGDDGWKSIKDIQRYANGCKEELEFIRDGVDVETEQIKCDVCGEVRSVKKDKIREEVAKEMDIDTVTCLDCLLKQADKLGIRGL